MSRSPAVRIREIFIERLGVDATDAEAITLDTPLLGRGLALDSVEALRLITAIEADFGILFDDDDLTPDLFETLGTLGQLVEQKLREEGRTE